jgi:hypothetical protein
VIAALFGFGDLLCQINKVRPASPMHIAPPAFGIGEQPSQTFYVESRTIALHDLPLIVLPIAAAIVAPYADALSWIPH